MDFLLTPIGLQPPSCRVLAGPVLFRGLSWGLDGAARGWAACFGVVSGLTNPPCVSPRPQGDGCGSDHHKSGAGLAGYEDASSVLFPAISAVGSLEHFVTDCAALPA